MAASTRKMASCSQQGWYASPSAQFASPAFTPMSESLMLLLRRLLEFQIMHSLSFSARDKVRIPKQTQRITGNFFKDQGCLSLPDLPP